MDKENSNRYKYRIWIKRIQIELNIEIQREFEYMKFNGSDIEFEYRNSNRIWI